MLIQRVGSQTPGRSRRSREHFVGDGDSVADRLLEQPASLLPTAVSRFEHHAAVMLLWVNELTRRSATLQLPVRASINLRNSCSLSKAATT
jgi:hypothetical protein